MMHTKSRFNRKEFNALLLKKTKQGNPYLLFTPFGIFYLLDSNNKIYLGRCTKNTFELTLKSPLLPTPYFISGEYNELSETETNVDYQIKPIRFVFWLAWISQSIITVIILFVSSIIFGPVGFGISLTILILLLGISSWIARVMKKQMDVDFRHTFKIVDL